MKNNTYNNDASVNEAVVEYIAARIKAAGNIIEGLNGKLYYVETIELEFDNRNSVLYVLCEGVRYSLVKNGDTFFIDDEVKVFPNKSVNDSSYIYIAVG